MEKEKREKERKREFKTDFDPIKKPDEYKSVNPSKEKYVDKYYSQEWSLNYFKLKQ